MQDGSSAQALPSTLPRSPVPAGSKSGPFGMCRAQQMVPTGTGPSSGTRQTKSLFLPEVHCQQKAPPAKTCTARPAHPGKVGE